LAARQSGKRYTNKRSKAIVMYQKQ